jgi:DNA-binding response OmpR family regulator
LTGHTVDAAAGTGVLLVEDDLVISRMMAKVLDDAGYRSLTVADHDQIGVAIERLVPAA